MRRLSLFIGLLSLASASSVQAQDETPAPESGAPPVAAAKGLVIGGGVGAAFDVTDQFFVNLGVVYPMGFQKMTVGGSDNDVKTKFLRIALGGGMKF